MRNVTPEMEIEELKSIVRKQAVEIAHLDKAVSELTELVMSTSNANNGEVSYLLVRQAL